MKRIVISIANSFDKDRRMIRTAHTLQDHGFAVCVVGKKTGANKQKEIPGYHIDCWFTAGFLFYLEFNIRLFFKLLVTPGDILVSVDSDTLLANTLISVLKRKPLVIDMHELFTEVPELSGHSLKKAIWSWIEKVGIAQSSRRYTVSQTIANEYEKRYGKSFDLIRNTPPLSNASLSASKPDRFTIAYIGALNMSRGLEQLIKAIAPIDDVELMIHGTGDIDQELIALSSHLNLSNRVYFSGWVDPANIHINLQKAHVGVNLLNPNSQSYYLSLANKYFDYIHAELPIISMNFPEYQLLNKAYRTSILIDDLELPNITEAILQMKDNNELYRKLSANCQAAKAQWNWQSESKRLISIFDL